MVEVRRPPIQASSREFGVFSGSSSKTREVPARRVGLSNHDDPNTLTWPEIQRLGGSEEAILVQRFDGTHAYKIAQEVEHGSRSIHVAPSAQRRRPEGARSASDGVRPLQHIVGRRAQVVGRGVDVWLPLLPVVNRHASVRANQTGQNLTEERSTAAAKDAEVGPFTFRS